MDTRFYTQFTHAVSVLNNKFPLQALEDEKKSIIEDNIDEKEKIEKFCNIIENKQFWKDLKFLVQDVLQDLRKVIGHFEQDESYLDTTYAKYLELFQKFK